MGTEFEKEYFGEFSYFSLTKDYMAWKISKDFPETECWYCPDTNFEKYYFC